MPVIEGPQIAVLIPVLERPARVAPLVASLEAAGRIVRLTPYWLVSPGDSEQEKAVRASGCVALVVPWHRCPGDYARKINYGFRKTDEPFLFLAADDLQFQPGWAERALAAWEETNCCVIGTNDLGNSRVTAGRHSTHTLVHRDYWECGTVDEKRKALHEGYDHNFVDDEFVQTAIARGTYHHAGDSIVEHLHPDWGKGPEDHTYRLGREKFSEDRALFNRRCHLWGGGHR